MKSYAVTVLLDAPDERTAMKNVVEYLNKASELQNIEVNDIEEIPE